MHICIRRISLLLCLLVVCSLLPMSLPNVSADPPGDDRFGIDWVNQPGSGPSDLRIRQAYQSGARWDRFPVYWPSIQPQAGTTYNWSSTDAWVDRDRAAGLNVQLVLLDTPGWASNGTKVPRDLSAPPAGNSWYQFVYQTVQHYKGRVKYYELWNEPDLGQVFWNGSMADFAQLIRVGYRAVKDADPSASVILAGLALPYDNRNWFFNFLDEMGKDPQAKANGYYFDVLALHMYSRSADVYEYIVGNAKWVGIRNVLKNRIGDKPIWINEAGVPIWNETYGIKGPGRATADEAAAYVIQSFAYGLAAGVDKLFFFQLYDDGVGQTDAAGNVIERYGLFANPMTTGTAGRARATYTAYQIANTFMGGTKLATRVNLNRTPDKNGKGYDMITLYGARDGKVTIVWNNEGTRTQQARIPASTKNAVVIDQRYNQRAIQASNGYYTIDLPPATNNNNFLCLSDTCDPGDYIIGGEPRILVEVDPAIPVATILPPSTVDDAPFWVGWKPVPGAPGANRIVGYEVQWMDAAEGQWRDWIPITTTTSALFGYGSPVVAKQYHTYLFRVRARDASGTLLSDYPLQAQSSVFVIGGKSITNPPPKVYTVADQFVPFYQAHDGLRLLGRPLSDIADGGGGMIQYFEKGRLEDHSAETSDPNWRYMYGLLAEDLLNARANIPIGGETSTQTYATLSRDQVMPPKDFKGGIKQNPDGSVFIPYSAQLAVTPGQNVPPLFWNYINDKKLFPSGWLHDIGLPVSPAVPVIVNKAGIGERWIVVQAFQRTILTYDPRNPDGWQVERANIGTDYAKAFKDRIPK